MKVGVIGFCELDTLEYMGNSIFIGGGALSTSIQIALWGVHVNLFSCLGSEFPLPLLYQRLESVSHCFILSNISSGDSIVRMSIKRENNDFSFSIIDLGCWPDTTLMNFNIMRGHFGIGYTKLPYQMTCSFLDYVTRNGWTSTAVNPQGSYSFEQLKDLKANLLFFNEKEICNAARKKLPEVLQDISELKRDVVITLGTRGVILYNYSTHNYYHAPAKDVLAIDTLGCGDAFAGGFIALRAKGKGVEDQIAGGILSAALETQLYGALPDPSLIYSSVEDTLDSIKSRIRVDADPYLLMQNLNSNCSHTRITSLPGLLKVKSAKDVWRIHDSSSEK